MNSWLLDFVSSKFWLWGIVVKIQIKPKNCDVIDDKIE